MEEVHSHTHIKSLKTIESSYLKALQRKSEIEMMRYNEIEPRSRVALEELINVHIWSFEIGLRLPLQIGVLSSYQWRLYLDLGREIREEEDDFNLIELG